MKLNRRIKPNLVKFKRSVWLFPAILTLTLFLLTTFQISGSSIGTYHELFYGKTKDSSLLANHPQAIRSDEWLVTTQLTIAQKQAGFPRVNPNIDSGRDMSVVGDAPYKDWSSIFKPQNLAFLVLPFENAFAFKWWLLLYLTIISGYFVALRFFPGRRLVAAMTSSAVALTPLLVWWYATGAYAPIFYGFFIMLLGLRIINDEKISERLKWLGRYSQAVYALGIGYLLTCFALVLYPPFQIPVLLAVTAFLAGSFLEKYGQRKTIFSRPSLTKLGVFLAGAIIAGAFVLLFIQSRHDVIKTIQNTAYPGVRINSAGHSPVHEVFSTYLQPQLERTSRAMGYYTNQSEASQFLLFAPFMIIPGFAVIYLQYRQKRQLNWSLLAIQLLIVLFFCNLFVPAFDFVYKLTGLSQVQHGRLFHGLGFAGVLQLLLIAKALEGLKIRRRQLTIVAGSYTAFCFLILLWSGQFTREHWPVYITNYLLIIILAGLFSLIIFCFLSRRLVVGSALLLIFSAGCVFHVHPIYRGLGPYYNGELSKAMTSVSEPGDSWINFDNIIYENAPLVNGRDSISGVKPYPDLDYWRQVEGEKGDYIYNRYAHVLFSSVPLPDQIHQQIFHLYGPDSFGVEFSCSDFTKNNVDYALAIHKLDFACLQEVKEVGYPAVTFYIYKMTTD